MVSGKSLLIFFGYCFSSGYRYHGSKGKRRKLPHAGYFIKSIRKGAWTGLFMRLGFAWEVDALFSTRGRCLLNVLSLTCDFIGGKSP